MYTYTLTDAADASGETTITVSAEVPDDVDATEYGAEVAARNSQPEAGLFYMCTGVARGDS